ncbi:MAG: glycogen-binding domain-containing protein [Verrucomicrobiia bacterium]
MVHDKSDHGLCSAPDNVKPVDFQCSAPEAKVVQLAGNFNHWHPILMRQQENGRWFIQIWLPEGYHRYRFLVDGKPTLDPHATGATHDEQGKLVSLITVS